MLLTGHEEVFRGLVAGDTFYYFTAGDSRSDLTKVVGPNKVVRLEEPNNIIYKEGDSSVELSSSSWNNCPFASKGLAEVQEMHGRYAMDDSFDDDDDD